MQDDLGIREVAALTGLTQDTLRWYEREGLIPWVGRDPQGRRRYDQQAMRMVELLVRLRRTGMPVAQMRRYVELVREGEGTQPERLELLRVHRRRVAEELAQLTSDLEALEHKIDMYERLIEEGP